MTQQMRLFDGHPVETFRGRLSAFDIEDEEADSYRTDQMLVLVVACRVDGADFRRTTDGGWLRTNKLPIHAVRVAKAEMRSELIDIFGLPMEEQLTFPGADPGPWDVPTREKGPEPSSGGSTAVEPEPVEVSSAADLNAASVQAHIRDQQTEPEWRAGAAAHDPALASFFSQGTP